MNKILTIILILSISVSYAQQNVEINKKEFKIDEKKDGYKAAKKYLKKGDYNYEEHQKRFYQLALDDYLKAYKYNPDIAELNYKIGVCYLKSVQRTKAVKYFEKAYKLKKNVASDILFLTAQAYQLNYKFDDAIKKYEAFKNSLSPANLAKQRRIIDRKIQECKNGKVLTANPIRILVKNMGGKINSRFPEYSPIITADEKMMIFTSRRDNTTGGERDPNDLQYYEDVYVTYNENNIWQKPRPLNKKINTKQHDATAGLSLDGTILFVYRNNDIYVSFLKGEDWTSPKPLPKTINSNAHEGSAALSPDGKILYFTSNRGGEGNKRKAQHDIYYSELNKKGKWGEAKKLSSVVNTEYDERSIFLHPDGKTLYFSSEGHNSMGSYDIYETTKDENGKWSKPKNMGYPINTPDKDVFFVVTASGRFAYYSSVQEGGMGETDLYRITFLSPEQLLLSNEDNLLASVGKPIKETMVKSSVKIKTIRLTIVKGTVSDAITNKAIGSTIEIVDNEENKVISTINANSSTGKFILSLPSGKNYGIAVKAEGYLFHSENFNIPQTTDYQEIEKDIKLLSMNKGASIVLKNIFFETAKAELRKESYPELERLLKVMTDYPKIKIEISGHTDNTGTENFNKSLSENRAKAVVDYLLSKNISTDRMEYKGYADEKPIATNKTPEGRQENRRVEFKILE